jgi:hypothetical protein
MIRLRVPKNIKLWERLWASTILLYTVFATIVVWKTLAKYGVNPIIFAILDAITSWTYGIGTARLVTNLIEKKRSEVNKWVLVSAISFILPPIYVLSSTSHAPAEDYYSIIGVIVALAIFSISSFLLNLRKKKKGD